MSKKILTFGASNSKSSINKQFAIYAASQIEHADVKVLDLNDFEMPIYSIDREKTTGIPELASRFKQHIRDADGIVVSMAEHNGAYTTAFKNIMDWMSRLEGKLWEDKPLFVLSTSPGKRGGKSVLSISLNSFPHQGARGIASFSLPAFRHNFSTEAGILDQDLDTDFRMQLKAFTQAVGIESFKS